MAEDKEEKINDSCGLVSQIEVLMKKTKTILVVILLLLMAVATISCSDPRSEVASHKWRIQSFEDRPPSLEGYFLHPGPLHRRDKCRDPR